MSQNSHVESLSDTVGAIITRLESMSAARDTAVNLSRHLVRQSANVVRAMHRGEAEQATNLLDEARSTLDTIRKATAPWPAVHWAGYVQDAMKEFAEASITNAILKGDAIPDPEALSVEDASYMNGLAEAASELRRDTLDALRQGETDRAEYLLATMDQIQGLLVTVDFADAVTGGLRRTTDQLRAVLERTRGDVTLAVRQDRLEAALLRAEKLQHNG